MTRDALSGQCDDDTKGGRLGQNRVELHQQLRLQCCLPVHSRRKLVGSYLALMWARRAALAPLPYAMKSLQFVKGVAVASKLEDNRL